MSQYAKYPLLNIPTYTNLAAFPVSAANGQAALALDTDILYVYNTGSVSWVPIAGAGSILTIGTIDSTTASANGAAIVLNQLIMQSASATRPGLVNNTTQSFSGNKTFTGTIIPAILKTAEIEDTSGILAIDVNNRNLTDTAGTSQLAWTTSGITVPSLTASQLVATNGSKLLVSLARGNLTAAGTDGIAVTSGSSAVIGAGTSIAQQVSDATHNGYLSSTDWNTFNNKQAALTLTNLTDVGTDGIVITNGTGAVIGASPVTIAQHVADSTHNGYLSSTDWSTFNAKQAAGNYITALTGDVTATGPGSVAATVAKIQGTTVSGTTGSTNVVFSNTPTLVTPVIGAATGTSLSVSGQLTSTVATGTAPLVVSSTTQVANLNAATAGSATSATNATNVGTTQVSNNASYFPLMVSSSTNGNQPCDLGTGLTYNPSTNILTTTGMNLSGLTASQAVVTDSSKNLASLAYTSANTASALVQRDGSNNFSAGTITAALTGTASGNTTISGQTNHGVVVASSTSAMTSTAAGTAGQVLQSGGASADPTWVSGYRLMGAPQVFTATGTNTYTRTTGATLLYVQVWGPGGGGGGADGGAGGAGGSAGCGGGGGAYSSTILTTGTFSANTADAVVGTGGTAGAASGGGNGGTGDISYFRGAGAGTIYAQAASGVGGTGDPTPSNTNEFTSGFGAGGTAATGNVANFTGGDGGTGCILTSSPLGGYGGAAAGPGGGTSVQSSTGNAAGKNGNAPGGGGSGANTAASVTDRAGGVGANGRVVVWEYIGV